MNIDKEAFSTCGDSQNLLRCGDLELLDILLQDQRRMEDPRKRMCVAAYIIAAKAVLDPDTDPDTENTPAFKTQVLTFSKEEGLECYDDDQPDGEKCHDYAVQYCCKSKIDIF